jgi:hypothetical protein
MAKIGRIKPAIPTKKISGMLIREKNKPMNGIRAKIKVATNRMSRYKRILICKCNDSFEFSLTTGSSLVTNRIIGMTMATPVQVRKFAP